MFLLTVTVTCAWNIHTSSYMLFSIICFRRYNVINSGNISNFILTFFVFTMISTLLTILFAEAGLIWLFLKITFLFLIWILTSYPVIQDHSNSIFVRKSIVNDNVDIWFYFMYFTVEKVNPVFHNISETDRISIPFKCIEVYLRVLFLNFSHTLLCVHQLFYFLFTIRVNNIFVIKSVLVLHFLSRFAFSAWFVSIRYIVCAQFNSLRHVSHSDLHST